MKILVVPNIFTAADKAGWPCGRTHVDPLSHPRPFDVFGGKLRRIVEKHEMNEREPTDPRKRAELAKMDPRDARVRVLADIKLRPFEVELSQYIRERVASGDLIAADKPSALACGIAGKDFREPLVVLSGAMQKLLDEWRASHDPSEPPALAGYDLQKVGDEMKLVKREKKVRPLDEAPAALSEATEVVAQPVSAAAAAVIAAAGAHVITEADAAALPS